MRLGIMGGTFNPPHNGHLHAAKAAREDLGLDKVLFIPTNIPPHKQLPEGSATSAQRLEMTRLMTEGLDWAVVSSMEIDRGGASYTVDTLRALSAPDTELYLIVGTDMLMMLDTGWRAPEEICRLATIVVYTRDEGERAALQAKKTLLDEKYDADIRLMTREPLPVSSTQVRAGDERLLPGAVADYIRLHRLYTHQN